MNKEKTAEFKALAKPLMKWLNDNYYASTTIIITCGTAQVLETDIAFVTAEFLKEKCYEQS